MQSKEIKIINKLGLHARASCKLVNIANKYNAHITISHMTSEANAKSIMGIMLLAATYGSIITITAHGSDEDQAIQEIITLINDKFGEGV